MGAIVGPMLGGLLMAAGLPLEMNCLAFALPGAISAFAMTIFLASDSHHARAQGFAPAV